jgi:NAD(P)H-flavin reductase
MAAFAAEHGRPGGNVYRPRLARVLEVREEMPERATARLVATLSLERQGLDYRPGQFLEVGVPAAGEVPISISSPPGLEDTLQITVRAAGVVSGMLARSRPGDVVSVRGPCGNGFPVEEYAGLDLLFVAGGIGLAPLRGLLWETLLQRGRYGRIMVLHGARSPRDLLYPWQYGSWRAQGAEVWLAADHGDGQWEKGEDPPRTVGFLPALFPRLTLDPARTVALLCGPPIMIKVACSELTHKLGLPPVRCVATLERHMKCGIGKCGHCVVVDRYVCMDGPVFRYDELQALERIESPW